MGWLSRQSWGQQWVGGLVLLGPAGLWLLLLLVIPTFLILEISLVPGLRLGEPSSGYGLGNYLQMLPAHLLEGHLAISTVCPGVYFSVSGIRLSRWPTGWP